jgi:peptidoglycan/LPS O-acetylase OafA/YrhL
VVHMPPRPYWVDLALRRTKPLRRKALKCPRNRGSPPRTFCRPPLGNAELKMTTSAVRTIEILPLTSLRFLAAVYVFLFHVHLRWPLAAEGTAAEQFLMNGPIGMSLFFILSGLVLGYRFNDGVADVRSYALGRFTRIYPVYVLAALVTVPWLITHVEQSPSEANPALMYGFIVFADALMLQAWMAPLFSYWNNGGSWSIAVEAFFYLCFPALVSVVQRQTARRVVIIALVSYLLTVMPGLSRLLFPFDQSFIINYSIPIFRLPEFVIGICLGVLFARGNKVPIPSVFLLISVVLLILHLSIGPYFSWNFGAHNYISVPLISIILVSAASLEKGAIFAVMRWRPFVYLGQISYSFYSFQALVVLSAINSRDAIVGIFSIAQSHYVFALGLIVTLTVVAAVSFELVEVRFRKFLHDRASVCRRKIGRGHDPAHSSHVRAQRQE